jgi:K+-sensing histidine kinase KdpD
MVVQHMNGEISFKSKLKKGTIFDFYIEVKSKKDDKGLTENENKKL